MELKKTSGVLLYAIWRHQFGTDAWFRLFGYGILVSSSPPTFSERHGFDRRSVRMLGVRVKLLTPGGF